MYIVSGPSASALCQALVAHSGEAAPPWAPAAAVVAVAGVVVAVWALSRTKALGAEAEQLRKSLDELKDDKRSISEKEKKKAKIVESSEDEED